MRRVAWAVFLAVSIGLALLTAGMFAFVLVVAPGECRDPSCLAVQTFQPGRTVDLPPTFEPEESGVPAPPVAPGSPPASPAPSPPATGAP